MRREVYIINKASGRIVNCVTSSDSVANLKEKFATEWPEAKFLYTRTPSRQQLEGYRFYWERP